MVTPSRVGGLVCNVGVEFVAELFSPCGDGDAFLQIARGCLQLTTERSEGTLLEAHGGISSLGPFTDVGTPKECTALGLAGPAGMSLVGQINAFHANFDLDVVSLMHFECE